MYRLYSYQSLTFCSSCLPQWHLYLYSVSSSYQLYSLSSPLLWFWCLLFSLVLSCFGVPLYLEYRKLLFTQPKNWALLPAWYCFILLCFAIVLWVFLLLLQPLVFVWLLFSAYFGCVLVHSWFNVPLVLIPFFFWFRMGSCWCSWSVLKLYFCILLDFCTPSSSLMVFLFSCFDRPGPCCYLVVCLVNVDFFDFFICSFLFLRLAM